MVRTALNGGEEGGALRERVGLEGVRVMEIEAWRSSREDGFSLSKTMIL